MTRRRAGGDIGRGSRIGWFSRAAIPLLGYYRKFAVPVVLRNTMKIPLYVRTYPVEDSPVALSLVPFPISQKATYTRDGTVYDAVCRETSVTVPDGSVVDAQRKLLCWASTTGTIKSKVGEVYKFVQEHAPGFGSGS
jgi:hypothetical protein